MSVSIHTHNRQATYYCVGSCKYDPRVVFYCPRRFNASKISRFLLKGFSRTITECHSFVVIFKQYNTAKSIYTCPHSSKPTTDGPHITLGTNMENKLFSKCRPTDRIRESGEMVSRVKVTRPANDPYFTGQSELAGRVGSGWGVLIISRVRSGWVKRFSSLAGRVRSEGFQGSRVGSGRVRRLSRPRGSLTRPDPT